jgi:hypothetical protein
MTERSFVYRHGRRIEVETILPPSHPPRRRRKDTFAKVPLAKAAIMAKATKTTKAMVWVVVLYEWWANKGKPFTLSNKRLAGYGVTHDTKRRALRELEDAGLIAVEQNGKRAPVVTVVEHTHGCV